jgi:hypothetical protein
LYQRICDYSLDDGESAFPFTQRLARENGWHLKFARRVVEEYKRFMFLAVAAGHPVTPSEQIDQAWHLHLIYSRSYWDEFCGQVLGTPIHHGPTKGGSDEQAKFIDLYEKTKASYERLLNESPPRDIWPDASRRFGNDIDCVRVSTREHWVIPKRRARRFALVGIAALVVVMAAGHGIRTANAPHAEHSLVPIGSSLVPSNAASSALVRSALWSGPARSDLLLQQASQRTVQHNRRQDNAWIFVLVIGMLAVVVFLLIALFNGKCSACGRTRAMKKTGKTERGTGWCAPTKDEWQCIYCGAVIWSTHYGGGCGGTSGCDGATHCGGGNAGCAASGCGGGGCGGGGCGGGGCGGGGCGGG